MNLHWSWISATSYRRSRFDYLSRLPVTRWLWFHLNSQVLSLKLIPHSKRMSNKSISDCIRVNSRCLQWWEVTFAMLWFLLMSKISLESLPSMMDGMHLLRWWTRCDRIFIAHFYVSVHIFKYLSICSSCHTMEHKKIWSDGVIRISMRFSKHKTAVLDDHQRFIELFWPS